MSYTTLLGSRYKAFRTRTSVPRSRYKGANRGIATWPRLLAVVVLVVASLTIPQILAVRAAVPAITHVVIIDQENHSFDNVLGRFCQAQADGTIIRPGSDSPCDGATIGTLPNGHTVALSRASDLVPIVDHGVLGQNKAIDAGRMDGFSRLSGCSKTDSPRYRCYSQFREAQIPNAWELATNFAISDRTFELRRSPSWGGHMVLASATLDGFWGNDPKYRRSPTTPPKGPGLGCDSNRVTKWWNGTEWIEGVPSCIPDQSGNGPFTGPGTSPVAYVPTIFDLLDSAGKSWMIYGAGGAENPTVRGYLWTICPTFYECFGSSQVRNLVPASRVLKDATSGELPAFALVTPTADNSQHNNFSMAVGDNWLGSVVSAIENGPEWRSTAIFITWDDCGCFYDHVSPLPFGTDWGIRVPMIIVSPYAKPGYTDSTPATYASLLAFTEHAFGLESLNPCGSDTGCSDDANAYDYADAFDFTQAPVAGTRMVQTEVPRAELLYIRRHPGWFQGT